VTQLLWQTPYPLSPRHPHNAVKVVIKTLKRDILITRTAQLYQDISCQQNCPGERLESSTGRSSSAFHLARSAALDRGITRYAG
jgi:hypothetical protein